MSVAISPAAATVALGAAEGFQAAVSGDADNSVTWDVSGIVGGNSALGFISNSQTTPDVTTVHGPGRDAGRRAVTVHAQSNANPSISAGALVTFTTAINLTVTPASATLAIGERQTFTVQVNNTPNQNVNWMVNGFPGGNAAAGQICVTGMSPCQPVSTSFGGTSITWRLWEFHLPIPSSSP